MEPDEVEEDEKEKNKGWQNPYSKELGYQRTQYSIKITFQYMPHLLEVQTNGFLADVRTAYPHQEAHSGFSGWLQVSRDNDDLNWCFCYIQNYPSPCFKYIANAQNQHELSIVGQRNSAEIVTVPGHFVRRILGYHDKQTKCNTHSTHKFQLFGEFSTLVGAEEVEEIIGHICGTITNATDVVLVSHEQKASGVVEEVTPAMFVTLEMIPHGEDAEAIDYCNKAGSTVEMKQGRWHQYADRVGVCSAVADEKSGLLMPAGPSWDMKFELDVLPSSAKIVVRVWNVVPGSLVHVRHDQAYQVGYAVLELRDQDGIPGPHIRHEKYKPTDLAWTDTNMWGTLDEKLDEQKKLTLDMKNDDGSFVGSVRVKLSYFEILHRDQLVLAKAANGGVLKGSLMDQASKPICLRFLSTDERQKMQWLMALRWMAEGCMFDQWPIEIPTAMLLPTEQEKCTMDISTLDLPFNRVTALVRGLYMRRVMGSHKPTLRRLLYTTFNLETHAFSSTEGQREHFDHSYEGIRLQDIRGLNCHLVLVRLGLLHFGKHKSMSYADQMEEYTTEIRHAALHVIQACVGFWVFKRRQGKLVNDELWPHHVAWRAFPKVYNICIEGAAATRIEILRILLVRFLAPLSLPYPSCMARVLRIAHIFYYLLTMCCVCVA